jgi:glycosyltransferase involved in cell wall biosynthesis
MSTVVHVIDGVSPHYGGPSQSVPGLVDALAKQGAAVKLRTVEESEIGGLRPFAFEHIRHRPGKGPLAHTLRASSDMLAALREDAREGAILHAHCLWLMPNVYPAWAKRSANGRAKLIHSTRGMLLAAAIARSQWKKLPFWLALQRRALKSADCLHATSEAEYEALRAAGLTNPIAIIPNAIEMPAITRKAPLERTVLSFGRLHPIKGLDTLVRAWSQLEARFPTWRLRIVGPAENGYDAHLKKLAQQLNTQRISIEPSVYGEGKWAVYAGSELFVLASLSENFGVTAAEALASGAPVIASKGTPWQGLERENCGWWIDHGADPLREALASAMAMAPAALAQMGARGRNWVERDFSWARVATDMVDVYAWLRNGGPAPNTVRLQ